MSESRRTFFKRILLGAVIARLAPKAIAQEKPIAELQKPQKRKPLVYGTIEPGWYVRTKSGLLRIKPQNSQPHKTLMAEYFVCVNAEGEILWPK